MLNWLRRMLDAKLEAPYRRERAKWKVALRWTTGALTDPHTKWSSASRIVGVGTAASMWIYTTISALTSHDPNPFVVGSQVALVTAALALRAKSTQEGRVPSSARRAEIVAEPLAAPSLSPAPPATSESI